MGQKLFSIITPVYNSGSKIEKTIKSVAAQDSDLYEYIIVDGASTDETLTSIKNSGGDFELVSEPDAGVYDAMNKGIARASGKYLYFLGAGDSLRPHALSNIARLMPREDLNFVYGNVYWEDQAMIYAGAFTKEKLRNSNICHQAVFYHRNIFDLIGGFELRFKILADYVFNIKCFGNGKVKKSYIEYVVANFEGGGISTLQKDESFNRERGKLVRKYLD
jgi:glycosyltransferase involved in cell wall biosynthesis